ncbi:MAG: sulfotransferase [Gammaproteobacteria bacterium]
MTIPPVPQAQNNMFEQAVQAYKHGDRSQSAMFARRVLHQQPRHVGAMFLLGSMALDNGDAPAALELLQAACDLESRHAGIWRALGMAHFALHHWQLAQQAFRHALNLGLRDAGLLNNLGLTLKELGEEETAIQAFQEALQLDPDDAGIHNNLAMALNRKHDYEAAIKAYRRSTQIHADDPDVWSNLALLLEQTNLLDEAENALSRGLKLNPQHGNLLVIAAKCARRRGTPDIAIARLTEAIARIPLNPGVRRSMEYELGRNYDRIGDTDSAFVHLSRGNRLTLEIWPNLAAGAHNYLAELDELLACFTPEWVSTWPDTTLPVDARRAAFLVSFPRSGTTLMDTILGAHPQISILEEEPCIDEVVRVLHQMPGGYPRALPTLNASYLAGLRDNYWRSVMTRLGTSATGRLVVDKNPFMSIHAAFIQRLLPGTPFIFALRHPCDVVLSCFMQEFGPNPVMANFIDLETTAQTYRRVMRLWLRYRELFPLQVYELHYEKLIEDKEGEMRKLLDFFKLPWSDNLADHTLHAHQRGRIYTPSYHQVIQPIYGDAVNRWRRYERYFGTTLEILRPYAEHFGYAI